MTTFSVTVDSVAAVEADRHEVWVRLADPNTLVRLTPLLTRIEAEEDTWTWHLIELKGLGTGITPVFTEHMAFDAESSIVFSHRPAPGVRERVGAEGRYDLQDSPTGVNLAISLTITADLPLPKSAGPAVRKVMRRTMTMMGDRFSANLLADLPPRTAGRRLEHGR
ncbi:SRPBCC family protein [Sporichthya sp.]|uniref:SRPBCC family protein n=1 Tax=Sporichthya sp. TaxID=65475 RepID=UPI0017B8C214|nr:SRPBCC family protein [Sporichthya sp.]MBA3745048.1 SRPBCC family protein [Sporichthya sp.]